MYLLLAINHEVRQIVVLGFQPDIVRARLVVEVRALGNPYIIVNMMQPVETIHHTLRRWLAENKIRGEEANDTIREIAKEIAKIMSKIISQ